MAGLEKTKAALVSGEAGLLLQAADGSSRERAQLRPPEGENTLVSCLFAHELGVAFARDRVIHAAVLAGGLSDRIRDEALRLSGIRDVKIGNRVGGGRDGRIGGGRPPRERLETE